MSPNPQLTPLSRLIEPLTGTEEKILFLMAQGFSDKEISMELNIAPITIRGDHKQNIYDKLGLERPYRSRKWAVHCARNLKLIQNVNEEMIQPLDIDNPYKGLDAFQREDAHLFFGREDFVEELLEHFRATNKTRFLALVGASGSGKSSVIRAGLIPALIQNRVAGASQWRMVTMFPRVNPFYELEAALQRVAASNHANIIDLLRRDAYGLVRVSSLIFPKNQPLLLVIDQFEELFTLVENEQLTIDFMDTLYAAVTDPQSQIRVVITLRADFLDRPLSYPDMGWLLKQNSIMMIPMSPDEIERAITLPARQMRVEFDPGVVAKLVTETNEQPGALPLLEFALTELYDNRMGNKITLQTYETAGGLHKALAIQADKVYATLNKRQQDVAHQLFLRLITLGQGTEDVRRRVLLQELTTLEGMEKLMEPTIQFLAANRLLTLDVDYHTGQPTVEVAHEALIREWERLREWLDNSRDEIKVQRQLSLMAEEWYQAKRDISFLARGARLEQFERWLNETHLTLTTQEQLYLNESIKQRDTEAQQESERKIRESTLERRSRTFLRGLVGVMMLALVVASGLIAFAFNERAQSEANLARAEQQRLYLQANEAMDSGTTGNVGLALAMRSMKYGYTPGAESAIMRASHLGFVTQILTGHQFELHAMAYSDDGSLIALGTEDGTRVYDTETGIEQVHLPLDGIVNEIIFVPDTSMLVAVSESDITVWQVSTGEPVHKLVNHAEWFGWTLWRTTRRFYMSLKDEILIWDTRNWELIDTIAHDSSEIGAIVVVDSNLRELLMHIDFGNRMFFTDAETGNQTCEILFEEGGEMEWLNLYDQGELPLLIFSVSDTANGKYVLYVWDYTTCTLISEFAGHQNRVYAFNYNAATDLVFSGDSVGNIYAWRVGDASIVRHFEVYNDGLFALAVSPDGTKLAIPQFNNANIFDLSIPPEPQTLSVGQEIKNYTFYPRFSPDGETLYIGGFGRYSRWSLSDPLDPLIIYPQRMRTIVPSPDGRTAAMTLEDDQEDEHEKEQENEHNMHLIDPLTGEVIRSFVGHTDGLNFIDFSHDGRLLGSTSFDTTGIIWDVETGELLHTLSGHTGLLSGLNFSTDDREVLTTSTDGTIRVWDVATGEQLQVLNQNAPVVYARFSPDGRWIAGADTAGFIVLWERATAERVHTLAGHADPVWTVDFSPDGSRLVSAGWDGTARIWDVETGAQVRVMTHPEKKAMYWAEFSPDGETIVTGAEGDDRVYLWRVNLDDVIESLCAQPLADLTPEQRMQYGITDDQPVCPQS